MVRGLHEGDVDDDDDDDGGDDGDDCVFVLATSTAISGRHRLVNVCTHSDLIVLPHMESGIPVP